MQIDYEDRAAWIEKEVKAYEARNGFELDAHAKQTLRSMLEKEYWHGGKSLIDHINGFDDGEPQTTPDFNHYNGTE